MRTIIISAFTGTGKTFYKQNSDLKVLDLNSDGISEEFFLENFIEKIRNNIGIADVILLDADEKIWDLLISNNFDFFLVYPHINSKDAFLTKFFKDALQRKETKKFKQLKESIISKWEPCIKRFMAQKYCKHIVLRPDEYIRDIMCTVFELA